MQDWASAGVCFVVYVIVVIGGLVIDIVGFRFGIINQRMVGNFNHGLIVYIYCGILGIDVRDISAIIYINVTCEFIVLYRDFFLFFHGVFCRITGDDEGIKINVD